MSGHRILAEAPQAGNAPSAGSPVGWGTLSSGSGTVCDLKQGDGPGGGSRRGCAAGRAESSVAALLEPHGGRYSILSGSLGDQTDPPFHLDQEHAPPTC